MVCAQVDLDGAEVDDDSSSSDGDDMDEDMADAAVPAAVPIKQPFQPVIDDDGFKLVQKRKGRR